jgi:hypothetical protein
MERGGALFPKPTAILYCLISDPDTCIGGEQGRLPASGAPNLTMHLCIFQVGIFRPQVLDSAWRVLYHIDRAPADYIYRGFLGACSWPPASGKGAVPMCGCRCHACGCRCQAAGSARIENLKLTSSRAQCLGKHKPAQ